VQAIVPAAGRGSRLRPATDDHPKALVEVAGRPLLSYVFDSLAPCASEYVVVVGYLGDRIHERFGSVYEGTPITYVEQPSREGLADAVGRTEPIVEDDFLQLNGDNVLRGNVAEVIETHSERNADATLLVERVSRERARRGGVLSIEDGTLAGIVEKPDDPPTRLSTTGCFAFSPRIFGAIEAIEPSERGEYELPDAIGYLLDHGGRIETVRLDGWRVNVNTETDIARAERRLSGESTNG
jgi:glucose-1-phosphate thymidylyltransferase